MVSLERVNRRINGGWQAMAKLSLPFESKYLPLKKFLDVYHRSMEEPEEFWAEQARQLDWFKTWDKVLEWKPPFARWFVGGQLNASYICIDRHVKTWRKNKQNRYPNKSRVAIDASKSLG